MSRAMVLILLCLIGCDRRADSKLNEVEKHLKSWSATFALTGQQFADGSVTRVYVRQIVKAGDEEMAEQQNTLAKIADQPKRRELEQMLSQTHEQLKSLEAV